MKLWEGPPEIADEGTAHPTWMLGGRPLPHIEDRGTEIDFSQTLVIGELGTDEAWNELFLFPPWIERIPHSAPFSSEKEHDHGI